MTLSKNGVVHFLLHRGLLTHKSVVDGDLMVVENQSRHQTFSVIRRRHPPSYFVKQARPSQPDTAMTLQREAVCYALAQGEQGVASLKSLMPRYYGYDPVHHLLITEWLGDTENLAAYHQRLGKFPTDVAAKLGEALGRYHRSDGITPAQLGNQLGNQPGQTSEFPNTPPWIFMLHQGNAAMVPGGGGAIMGLVQHFAELSQALDRLQQTWQAAPPRLIHSDMKWENCLVSVPQEAGAPANGAPPNGAPANGTEPDVKIVDWETAALGDPYWDVGSIFHSYLRFWVLAMPATPDATPAQLAARAPYQLEDMQPSAHAFWRAYVDSLRDGRSDGTSNSAAAQGAAAQGAPMEGATAQGAPLDEAQLLERCINYAAARLLQTAFEYSTQFQYTLHSALLAQVSQNIFLNPRGALQDLFGFSA